MNSISELSAPAQIQDQIRLLCMELRRFLAGSLTGIYLHGSVAMGCFHPDHSDLDIMVVVTDPLSPETKHGVIEGLIRLSKNPAPVEISLLTHANLRPWRYPTPYDLHFGEEWRRRFEADLASGAWRDWDSAHQSDPDLAAHITVLRERGISLLGPSATDVFPPVPPEHYIESILTDYRWARQRIEEYPVYAILNMARVLLYLVDGRVSSKEEAGRWAVDALPDEVRPTVETALNSYRGDRGQKTIWTAQVHTYVETIDDLLNPLLPSEQT